MLLTKYISELTSADFGKKVSIAGWLQDVRNLGGIAFLQIRDRTDVLQVTVIKKSVGEKLFDFMVSIPRESSVLVSGVLQENKDLKKGFELLPEKVEVLGFAGVPLPLGVIDKVHAEFDTRITNRFLDLRKNWVQEIFVVRHMILKAIRNYMDANNFIEIQTPKIVAAGAEGGATLFQINYFDSNAYLAQSPQLYKQMMMATGFDKVYEIAPAFRAEPSATIRHLAEFTTFDAEIAFIESQRDVMRVLEECTAHTIDYLVNNATAFKHFNTNTKKPRQPFLTITYKEALEILAAEGKKLTFGDDLDTESEKLLGRVLTDEKKTDAYFVVEYPTDVKPFYIMTSASDPTLSYSFDFCYKGLEIASGGQREHRYDRLVEKMKHAGLNIADFAHYLKCFQYGMPPHGGWGFGIDRFVQALLGLDNIRETVLFPRDKFRLVP